MTSTFAGAPVVCCNLCAGHKLRRARNPGENGLSNFHRLPQRRNVLAANSALARKAKFRQRNLVAKNELVYRDTKRVLSCAAQFLVSDLPMTPSSLVIVTDRGSLKAYRVHETPTRGPSLQLVQAFNMTDAHGRLVDKVSDLAGRFPVTEGAGAHRGPASIAERTQLATETDRRIQKELADQIAKIVSQNGKEGWSFAAPAEIHTAIVDLLPGDVRQRIVEHVKSDLVKVEPARLISHFRSLRQI